MYTKAIAVLLFSLISLFAHADDHSKQKKLSELINVMDMDSMVDAIYSQMEGMMVNMADQLGVQPSEKALFDQYYAEMIAIMKEDLSWAKMEPSIADIYSRNFSESEIDDMLAFYKTETGQSIIKKMPIVMNESMQLSQTLMQGSIPKIQAVAQKLNQDLQASRKAQ